MKGIALATGLAPAFAQDAPQNPPIIDHSDDTLQVEPTHSTITIMVPTQ
jgi:hypothetical protein